MSTATTDSAAAARRFALACGVLSQFVKAAGPVPMPASAAAARVGAVQEPDVPPAPADGAQQLTIFYGGRVVVLDGFTPARAAELIRYASAAAASPANTGAAAGTPAGTPATALVDIPIARKASLQRFLSKRKDRSVATIDEGLPYRRTEEAAPPQPKKGKTEASSWLALGSLGDMHARDRSPQHA
jgi:jasmonate ZIM domain-containing protein